MKGFDMKENLAVATRGDHLEAERDVKRLQQAGLDMPHISIIGKDYSTEERVLGFGDASEIQRARDLLHTTTLEGFETGNHEAAR
jgi:hypothetical protein